MTNQNTAALPAFSAAEREQQRITHLVLGAPRPRRKVTAKRKKTKAPIVLLAPGIEERVRLREDWSHKQGTPETHAHAAAIAKLEGSLGRLQRSGAIDAHQAAAAELIAAAHQQITADVAVRTAKLEPRGSGGGANAASAERIAAVILERRYTEWRDRVGPFAAMMLAIIVDGMTLGAAARRWRMSDRRARALLVDALNQWGRAR
ncbi:hypothetical protein [Sphingomonas phyllosphaerae]|uniref:hypothetical protein n=1 Tax=Sphingomonas phyllosphaerae TaxID=257003 RepID=UPI000406AFD4|nr:hypothetical protein [Sphingomonas phyllosphaerae]